MSEGDEIRVGKRCYVGNLSYSVAWQDLKDKFRNCGNVVYANVAFLKGRSQGWGIVEFETAEEAVHAIQTMNGQMFMNRPLLVREDREDKDLKPYKTSTHQNKNGGSSGLQVVVQGIPFSFTPEDLYREFGSIGDIENAEIASSGGQSRGFGTIRFTNAEDAQRAINKFNRTELAGRNISVFLDRYA
uniref:RRM domain-containing protein n=1 Tax=Polytomella parva TaxID=51329 RepID=A0A7S0YB34_9CHLO|mmetsp:Transcript_14726/g.25939  ORF Transcript_14726/g.25939 Transcript_14726/m.25939 type:complete len:187 (+) Transcript_14726:36-596(+)|eukprot:CAMPEP_0175052366 /NCGR_PEP_ID=MMETSP0052_2-20121109/8322_1 /TAXON_ID=51329 ORGANISM="Polytomella parva, Strain SAG 63-3" /NCGR_SAMPLE_ID=MMETSP0052_2 /ASSEMBLY_ACC=CAM_ASM_000194 /LENGTH=186 /DNA_ID=CAMNT_0016316767 /DNA_START=29 /DNA_END=589 /DNA_ORIENTATION=-